MGKKLYCGNLSYGVTNADLDQIFGAFGTVQSAEVIMDRDTGRSKGFGFVEMGSDDEAQAAIAGVNGTEHGGRTLTVNEARPREPRSGGGGPSITAVIYKWRSRFVSYLHNPSTTSENCPSRVEGLQPTCLFLGRASTHHQQR